MTFEQKSSPSMETSEDQISGSSSSVPPRPFHPPFNTFLKETGGAVFLHQGEHRP